MKLSISMTHNETMFGWLYLLFSTILLPKLLQFGNTYLVNPLSESWLNIVFFVINFLCVVAIFHRYLGKSIRFAFRSPGRCLRFAVLGLIFYLGATTLFSHFIFDVAPDFSNINDVTILSLAQDNYTLMSICIIFLVPVAEETFYRGLIFQGLQRTNRILAYIISTVLFSAIHIIGYIGSSDFQTLLLCFLQYLPAGIALGWAYEEADTIVAPILMHIAINQIGMSAMR